MGGPTARSSSRRERGEAADPVSRLPTVGAFPPRPELLPARGQLCSHRIHLDSQHRSSRGHITLCPQRCIGHGQHTPAKPNANLDLRIHSRPQESILVGYPDQHRKHGHVLLGDGLRLDLQYPSLERLIGVCIHPDVHLKAGLDLSDVCLIDQGADPYRVQIGHEQQHGATTDVAGGRLNHRPDLDVPLENHAGSRRPDLGILERNRSILQRAFRPHQRGVGVGPAQPRIIKFPLRDGLSFVECFSAAPLGFSIAELGLGYLQVGFRLR